GIPAPAPESVERDEAIAVRGQGRSAAPKRKARRPGRAALPDAGGDDDPPPGRPRRGPVDMAVSVSVAGSAAVAVPVGMPVGGGKGVAVPIASERRAPRSVRHHSGAGEAK